MHRASNFRVSRVRGFRGGRGGGDYIVAGRMSSDTAMFSANVAANPLAEQLPDRSEFSAENSPLASCSGLDMHSRQADGVRTALGQAG